MSHFRGSKHTLTGYIRAGCGVVRIDPLNFLAGCRTKRINQVSVVYLSMFYCIVVY